MKKIYTLLLATMITTSLCAQQTIKLQVSFIPDHQYNLETKSVSKIVMDVQVDDATKEQLKSSGMVFPMNMDMDQNMTVEMKTGKLNDKKEVPLVVEYTQFDIKQKMGEQELPSQPNALKGMKASGWGESKGKIRFDKVEGEGVTDEIKKTLISMTDQMGTQIVFPDKPLKVGDEFTQEIPMNMPIQGGVELKMIIKTTYKLISFDKEKANFDTIVTMTMDLSMDKGTMSAEGAGKGKMVFDLGKNYLSTYDSNLDMNMKMKMGTMDMDLKSSTESTMTVSHL